MLLTININYKRSAMSDSYKNIINEFSHKNEMIVVVPNAYGLDEFSNDFFMKIKENFTNKGKVLSRLHAINFARTIRSLILEYKVDKCFLYCDSDWINPYLIHIFKKFNVKCFIWVHDPILHSGESTSNKIVRAIVAKYLYPLAQKLIVSYAKGIDDLSMAYNVKKAVIQNITLPEMKEMEFPELKEEARNMSSFKYDVIFFGRIEKYKGIDILIESINLIKNRYKKDLKVLIVGTGRQEDLIKQEICTNDNFTFINEYVDNKALANFIIGSKIVVCPYVDATGTQVVQIANYYNKPVVANNVGCFSEYVEPYRNGSLVSDLSVENYAKAILDMYDDKFYNSIIEKIPALFQKKFCIHNIVKELENIIGYN